MAAQTENDFLSPGHVSSANTSEMGTPGAGGEGAVCQGDVS